MANIITITDNRTTPPTREITVGDTIISGKISVGNPVMVIAVGAYFGFLDIMSATVLYTGATIKDCLTYYAISYLDEITCIIPGENVDVSLIGDKNAGANITLPV